MLRFYLFLVSLLFSSMAFAGSSSKKVEEVVLGKNVKLVEDVSKDRTALVCSKGEGDKLYCRPPESGVVEFTTNNLVVLRGPITSQSASKFVREFLALEHRDEVRKIYVYISSPGGSIFAGDAITNVMASSQKEVVAVIDFAASMAFHVSQFASKRMMVPTGTMMQHHASGGVGPAEFPNIDKQWAWIKRKVERMQLTESTRCYNTTLQQFKKNIDRDWWLLSDEALQVGCIDAVAEKVVCSKDLMNTTVKESISFFGLELEINWSGCPLETYPRSFAVKKQGSSTWYSASSLSEEESKIVEDYLLLASDPLLYYNTRGSFDISKFVTRKSTSGNQVNK